MTEPSATDRLPDLDPDRAAELLERGEAVLIDVREPQEWAAGHAPQAEHLPLGRLTPDAVPQDRPVIAVCRSGNRSGKAADALAAAGVRVHNLAGGMAAWARAGLPVVTDDGTPGTVA
ncbi:rhodanese-like domain-containing protein [Blastococcus tunisiensis]|uniref:Rhodanese-related sulfurtransferase n=1 Tax=Blastococcus tunisiensis TaxID=1798228 RepID=A0A1I2IR09_9ACTN|nr:rhodanese-like domain-containing protein [Blastococcus sp. DSM 46838]SFF43497.1 Rhodanese-related sulfurtransferase [Blastococcus sp. DSM 46838]